MPRSSGRQIDLEAQAAVGINGLSIVVRNANVDLAPKILVPVGCTQLRRVSRPFRRDVPAPDNVFGFDLEYICEVASGGDFQVEADSLHSLICNINILVDPAIERPAEDERQSMFGDVALLRLDHRVC